VVCDVVFLICAVVGPRWRNLAALVEASLEGDLADDVDEKRIRAALADLRRRRWADIGQGNVYEATTSGRRHLSEVIARIHRDKIRLVYTLRPADAADVARRELPGARAAGGRR
jgi:hypothetical protein